MEIGKHAMLSTLQRFDLMGTGCKVDEFMPNEYASEAERIARLVADGKPVRDAIMVTFDDHFWEGCLLEPERAGDLERLVRDLQGAVRH
ncbi:MAG: hypothetical protein JWP29_26 [Rhodoferax sp.]|nr:hypothetical protein [Rhodoferax sp.]